MVQLWRIPDLPVHLAMWVSRQSYYRGQDGDGIAVELAVPEGRKHFLLDEKHPLPNGGFGIRSHCFSVDYESKVLRWVWYH